MEIGSPSGIGGGLADLLPTYDLIRGFDVTEFEFVTTSDRGLLTEGDGEILGGDSEPGLGGRDLSRACFSNVF